jgi:hypothetical protein
VVTFGGCEAPRAYIFDGELTALVTALHKVNHFYQGMLIPWQSHHDILVCIPGLAMSGDDGMDSTLEYILSDACGFLLLYPFMPRLLRPPLPEAWSGRCLCVVGSPLDV